MSFISQANGPANLGPRLKLAASALVLVALSGCVSVDDAPRKPRPFVNAPVSAQDPMQRPPGEVRLTQDGQDRQVEPVIQKGTGRFVDSSAQLNRTGRGNYVVKLVDLEIADAVQQVLADTLGLNYVIEGNVAGKI